MLLKAAYTGVAASLIDGKTTHVIGGVSLSSGSSSGESTLSDEAKAKLEFWKPIKNLFVDEMSMLAKDFFALLSRNASIGKKNLGEFFIRRCQRCDPKRLPSLSARCTFNSRRTLLSLKC